MWSESGIGQPFALPRNRNAYSLANLLCKYSIDEGPERWPAPVRQAGKTEISKEYVAALDELREEGMDGLGNILRIDPDDLRDELP